MVDQTDRSGTSVGQSSLSITAIPVSRRKALQALALSGIGGVLVACGGTPAAPTSSQPAPTLAVAAPNAGGLATATPVAAAAAPTEAPTEAAAPTEAPTEAAAPTEAPTEAPAVTEAPTEAAAVTEAPAASSGGFVLNGVTLPYERKETLVLDQGDYHVFDSFNIYIPNGNEFAQGYQQVSVEYLWYANYVTGDITPWLGQSYSYNSDTTELTVKITPDATWNDGQPFTADDVVFTMNMLMKDPTLSSGGATGYLEHWKEITAPDPQTVLIKMIGPQPRMHEMFYCTICTGFQVEAKHIWEKQDPKTFKNNPPVTTGPWMLEKIYPEQRVFVWKRNDNYWKKDQVPAAKYLIYRSGPTADQTDLSIPELKAHTADSTGLPGYDQFVKNTADLPALVQVAYLDPCPRGIWFNCMQAPFDKAEFRRAFSMLVNRPKIAENIWAPPTKPAEAPWADYRNLDKYINKESNDKWGVLKFDPDAALKLILSVGYKQDGGKLLDPDGKQVTFEIVTPAKAADKEYLIGQDLAEEAGKLGMQVSVKTLEGPTFDNAIDEGNWAVGSWWLCGATVDPVELFKNFTGDLAVPIGTRASNGNSQRLKDDAFDKVINELKAVPPEDPKAAALYQQAYDEWMRALPGTPVVQTIYTTYWDTTYWKGGLDQKALYTVPFNWWGQFMFVTLKVTPVAA